MENESYESSINRDPGDIKVKVDPREKTIDIPLAQLAGTGPQPHETVQQQPGDRSLKPKTELGHPVDRMVDNIRQEYEDGPERNVEPGVRV